jgi:acyl-CoA synthetase (AMP-forming)/AMP-acid ligase II
LREATGCFLHGLDTSVSLRDLRRGSSLGGRLPELAGRSVLLITGVQLTTALALIELDGVARRITLCPSDVEQSHLPGLIAAAEVDAIVSDDEALDHASFGVPIHVVCRPLVKPAPPVPTHCQTEWTLLTSGTTGLPKMVVHSLSGLTIAIKAVNAGAELAVWSTFYDIRRYGGLQIFLRAILGGASLILSDPRQPLADFLGRLGAGGVTHISGTPSHWRRVLMSPAAQFISPRYVRLSGEIADQALLDNLRMLFPHAQVSHAYASTEAGVGFAVDDGREGFPAALVEGGIGPVQMKVLDGSLRVRSNGTATRYVGANSAPLLDSDGFVDTGDLVERRGDRYYFVGRRGGIINVGGLKVNPEDVETVINRHPDVRMALVKARKNPMTGAIVTADVVVKDEAAAGERMTELKRDILEFCRQNLAHHKVPAAIRFVPSLEVSAGGKLKRHYA